MDCELRRKRHAHLRFLIIARAVLIALRPAGSTNRPPHPAPRWLALINACWCVGICYSTLATKQHLLIDVLAGAALGLAGGWWTVRASRSSKQRVQ